MRSVSQFKKTVREVSSDLVGHPFLQKKPSHSSRRSQWDWRGKPRFRRLDPWDGAVPRIQRWQLLGRGVEQIEGHRRKPLETLKWKTRLAPAASAPS